MIYLDYSATTPVAPEVLNTINRTTNEFIGNANSINGLGIKSKNLMDEATKQIASLFNISEDEITYTSSSTESNNMAIIGAATAHFNRGKHIIVSRLEHPSIYAICNYLQSIGFEISYVKNDSNGIIDLKDLQNLIKKDTILVSICAVNSELGIRQPLSLIKSIIKKCNKSTIFHSDLTQAIGKINVTLNDVDMASISSHKIYGPKGIAMLYKNKNINIKPIIYGSGKSNELNPGTPALPLIVGFSKALRLSIENLDKHIDHVLKINKILLEELLKYKDITINNTKDSIPHIINISLLNIKPETFIHALDKDDIYVSSNTACASGNLSSSIMAVYNDKLRATHSIRISLSHLTTNLEIKEFLASFKVNYDKLNTLIPKE